MFSVFATIPAIIASIGLILGTSSFISGLQLVKSQSPIEGKIHRFNGYASVVLYLSLWVISFIYYGFGWLKLFGWPAGFCLLLMKIWIVRNKKRRVYKYISWIGAMMILTWLYLVIINIPL